MVIVCCGQGGVASSCSSGPSASCAASLRPIRSVAACHTHEYKDMQQHQQINSVASVDRLDQREGHYRLGLSYWTLKSEED